MWYNDQFGIECCIDGAAKCRMLCCTFLAIIANFRKSDCQSANVCLYQPEDNYDTFRVKLNVQGFQHDKYTCHPDDPSLQLQVKRCSEQTDKPTEDNKSKRIMNYYS